MHVRERERESTVLVLRAVAGGAFDAHASDQVNVRHHDIKVIII